MPMNTSIMQKVPYVEYKYHHATRSGYTIRNYQEIALMNKLTNC